jgi:rhamnose transport system substrate-binding protein
MNKTPLSLFGLAAIGLTTALAPVHAQAGYTICFMPKFVAHPVFTQANEGAQQAGKELSDKVIYAGSTEINVARQIEWIGTCTKQHVDGIAITALDPNALAPLAESGRRGRRKGHIGASRRSARRAKAFRVASVSGKDGRGVRQSDGRRHELGRRAGVAVERAESPQSGPLGRDDRGLHEGPS